MRIGIRWLGIALAGFVGWAPSAGWSATNDPATDSYYRLMREAATSLLREGNTRFATGHPQYPNMDAERRHNTVAEGQQPFATVLACSDSRDPVELLFDRGVGDIFVIRVAGNVAGVSEMATIEYGVVHLNTPLLVVMGHSQCGAVTAVATGAELHGFLPKLAERIAPAVAKAKEQAATPEEIVPRAIEANVWQVIDDILRQSEEVRDLVTKGRLLVVGANYDLESGQVKWLGIHPDPKALLGVPSAVAEKGHGPPAPKPPSTPIAKNNANSNAVAGAKSAPGAKAVPNTKPVVDTKPPDEAGGKINPTPGLDIDLATPNVLPSTNKKAGDH
jgi:carbonic anhydrase